jgi:nucleotide-binding universal stress UspA family protein
VLDPWVEQQIDRGIDMMKRILLGLGGTRFTSVAIERAVELAQRHRARIKAVTVVNPQQVCNVGPVPAGGGYYAKKMCENRLEVTHDEIEKSIAVLQDRCDRGDVDLSVEREAGDSFALVLNHARYHDLTIFGLRSLFEYRLVNDPEKDLLKLLSKGVRPIVAVSDQFRRIDKVMVAYNGSMDSANAMQHFVQLSLWPDAMLDIVCFGENQKADQELLDDAAAYCSDHGYAVNTQYRSGKVQEQLLNMAGETGADMIVMGRGMRSMLVKRVLGDTVMTTLSHADLPLFLSQ